MSKRPLHQCNSIGCMMLTRQPRCERHKKEGRSKPGDPFYSSRRWRRLRASVLMREPLCGDCLAMGRTTEATTVHHRVKRLDDTSRAFDPTNLMALCKSCHDTRTGRGE